MNLSTAQSSETGLTPAVRHAAAWVALCAALGVHIVDEALTDFLSVYNPAVRAIHERIPWAPLPTFTFEVWLGGLIVAVIVLSSLTVFVLRGSKWMIPVSYVFGAVMFGNGLGHIAGSFGLGRPMPGVYSAPLLLVASVYLLIVVSQRKRRNNEL